MIWGISSTLVQLTGYAWLSKQHLVASRIRCGFVGRDWHSASPPSVQLGWRPRLIREASVASSYRQRMPVMNVC